VTDRQTDTQTCVSDTHFASSMTHVKRNHTVTKSATFVHVAYDKMCTKFSKKQTNFDKITVKTPKHRWTAEHSMAAVSPYDNLTACADFPTSVAAPATTAPDKTAHKPPSTCTAFTPSPPAVTQHTMESSAAVCCTNL